VVNVRYHLQVPGYLLFEHVSPAIQGCLFLVWVPCLSVVTQVCHVCMYMYMYVMYVHSCVQVGAVHDMFKHTYIHE